MNTQSALESFIQDEEQSQLLDRLFIGAGAMKSGTTWLYQVLDKHPDIFFSLEKEIHYFYAVHVNSSVLSHEARLRNVRDKYLRIQPDRCNIYQVRQRLHWASNYLDCPIDDIWYRNLFSFRQQERFLADFSNLYALLPTEAWKKIASSVGQLKVLYTMRHPGERLWSHLKFHLRISGNPSALDNWSQDDLKKFTKQPFIWENTEYGTALVRMKSALPGDTLKAVFYEDIHRDEVEFLRGIENFLGIANFNYPTEVVARRVNTGERRSMPNWFADFVASDVERIIGEVRVQGLQPPKEWGL